MAIVYPIFRLIFGTLYPAYASYKAVRTRNVKEYVKWMMYWIVFALFTCFETFTDVFFGFWFPFYYEFKIALVLWMLLPATKGSSFLYRKFVHPMLTKRETEIDECIARAKEQGYTALLQLGSQGMSFAKNVIMETAIKQMPVTMAGEGQRRAPPQSTTDGARGETSVGAIINDEFMAISDDSSTDEWMPPVKNEAKKKTRPRRGRSANSNKGGGGIVNQLRKSYSLCDLTKEIELRADMNRNSMGLPDECVDGIRELQSEMRTRSARQKAAAAGAAVAGSHMDLYFPEVDVNIRSHPSRESSIPLSQIRSTDDISSGYSSTDPVYGAEVGTEGLIRTGSLNTARVRRPREDFGRGRVPKRGLSTEDSDEFDLEDADLELPPSLMQLPISSTSSTHPTNRIPFIVNTNVDQLANQLAFINLLNANQAFMSRFLTDGNVVESMLMNRNRTDVIVQEPCLDIIGIQSSEQTGNLSNTTPKENTTLLESKCSSNTPHEVDKNTQVVEEKILESKANPDSQTVIINKPPNECSINQVDGILTSDESLVKKDENNSSNQMNSSEHLGCLASDNANLEKNELKPQSPRKGRYGKKLAPRPPSLFISNDEQVENEDFLDAESGIEETDFVGKAPDILSELGVETNSGKPLVSIGDPPELNVVENKFKSNNKSENSIDKLVELDASVYTSELVGKEKTKEKPSKFSKLLPKTSHSLFNFFHLREPSHSDTKSCRGSSEDIQNIKRNSPSNDVHDEIVIPLTGDDLNDNENSEFFESYQDLIYEGENVEPKSMSNCDLEVREMSQSPTAKRKQESDV